MFLVQEETSDGGGLLFPLLMIAGLFAVFYFLLIRPNRRRRQTMERLQNQLSVGDEVMTSSGLYGTVAELDEKTVILETSEGVYSRYARGAVLEVVSSTESAAGGEAGAESDAPDTAPEAATEPRDSKD